MLTNFVAIEKNAGADYPVWPNPKGDPMAMLLEWNLSIGKLSVLVDRYQSVKVNSIILSTLR